MTAGKDNRGAGWQKMLSIYSIIEGIDYPPFTPVAPCVANTHHLGHDLCL
jgi:hypothetical protein